MLSFVDADRKAREAGDRALAHVAGCLKCHPLSMRRIDPPMPDLCPDGTAMWGEMLRWVDVAQEALNEGRTE